MASLTSSPAVAGSRPVQVPEPRDGAVIRRIGDRLAGGAALVAGVFSLITGVLQIVFPQDETPEIDPRTRLILVMFTLSLWALAVVFLGLARYAKSSWGAWVAGTGTVLLTVGTVTSAAYGIDQAFFPPVAMAANALWLVGAIGLSVSLARARRVSLWFAILLPIVQVALVLGSQLGGGLVAGAFLVPLGAVLLAGRIQSRAAARLRR
ncbi:hypothetical protein [Microbacterium sp. GXF7504]